MAMKIPPLNTNLEEIGTIDISAVQSTLNEHPELWDECDYRQKSYDKHQHTKSIMCIWSGQKKLEPQVLIYKNNYKMFEPFINELLPKLKEHFNWKKPMFIYKAMFAKLTAKKEILPHIDMSRPLRKPQRIHVPIFTEDHLVYTNIGKETYHLKAGTIYNFNNTRRHGIKNDSTTDRVNFIIDVSEVGTLPRLENSLISITDLKDARVKIF